MRNPGDLQEDAVQQHKHEIPGAKTAGHQLAVPYPHGYSKGGLGNTINATNDVTDSTIVDAHETRPTNVALLFCEKQ
ncbi:MAG: hypothetical protein KDJ99_11860 [Candidatus Competibacteraceae bacterium]|nr:hypothetical protein [Candidatus Competibacteraceae bacterium]